MNNYYKSKLEALSKRDAVSTLEASKLLNATFALIGVGLVISALAAYAFYAVPDLYNMLYYQADDKAKLTLFGWVILLAPLGLVLLLGPVTERLSGGGMVAFYVLFTLIMGASLSSVFITYTTVSIVTTFMICAATFIAMALFGMATKIDLSGMGVFLYGAVIGLIVATIAGAFLNSTAFDYIVSVAGVVIFSALIAYDTQQVKEDGARNGFSYHLAVLHAISLYLNFVNLMLYLLRIFGEKKD